METTPRQWVPVLAPPCEWTLTDLILENLSDWFDAPEAEDKE